MHSPLKYVLLVFQHVQTRWTKVVRYLEIALNYMYMFMYTVYMYLFVILTLARQVLVS